MSQGDNVGLSRSHNRLGLMRINDQFYSHSADIRLAADLRGKGHLKAIAV
ncbi:hypothetical protein [Microvirgula aerodenitrificans]|nr:hypothetical protein [Microvirgula aerodenitrificans]